MNQLKPLVWKEWFEIRVFFGIALFVFLGLPLLGAAEGKVQNGQFELMSSVWVYFLGGVFAVFVGVGTVVRDMNGRLEDFWRSRPVGVGRWLIVKYFVGLAVVLFTLTVPLLLEMAVNRNAVGMYMPPQLVLAWHPFLWAAVYSVGFLMACLTRRGAHAAMLSIAVMLLLYYLPDVIPPLRHLGISWATDESQFPRRDNDQHILPGYYPIPWTLGQAVFHPQQLQFPLAMVLVCALLVAASVWFVWRDVRVESGRKTIYWSIGGAIVVLLASAAFQVGTNMTLLAGASLPKGEWIESLLGTADHALVVSMRWLPRDPSKPDAPQPHVYFARSLRVSPSGLELGQPVVLGNEFWYGTLVRPEMPELMYQVRVAPEGRDVKEDYPILRVMKLGASGPKVTEKAFPDVSANNQLFALSVYPVGDKLYLLFVNHVLVFDISTPDAPKLLSKETIDPIFMKTDTWFGRGTDIKRVLLPQVTGLSPRQRLELRLGDKSGFDGDIVVSESQGELVAFHLDELTDTVATFRRAGGYEATPVQKLFGSYSYNVLTRNGRHYASVWGSKVGARPQLMVFDSSDPRRFKPLGHLALPDVQQVRHVLPLSDGRVIAAGDNKLWLIGAPPGAR